jgi:hypothetical protein
MLISLSLQQWRLPVYNADSTVQTCSLPDLGYGQSFEDFAQDAVINDASDKDQCRNARELLGFDRDYPYDSEVAAVFNDMACGIGFTLVDHMTEGLAAPPVITKVEYEA